MTDHYPWQPSDWGDFTTPPSGCVPCGIPAGQERATTTTAHPQGVPMDPLRLAPLYFPVSTPGVRPRTRVERMKRHARRELGSRDVMVVAEVDLATGAARPAIEAWSNAWREFHRGPAYVERIQDPVARTVTFRMVTR